MDTEQLLSVFNGLIVRYRLALVPNEPKRIFKGIWAADVEHDESGNFVGCGFYSGDHIVYYYSDLSILNSCDFHAISLVCHNGVSDIECLRLWGIDIKDEQLYWDTFLIGHIIDSSEKSYGLKPMVEQKLNFVYPSYDDICGKKTAKQAKERVTLDKQPVELVMMYNAMDCYATWELYERQIKNLY